MVLLFTTAFIIGLSGSFHCIGMCGPLALALPFKYNTFAANLLAKFLYNLGRITTYSFLGIIIGLLGLQVMLSGYQQSISIGLGILLFIFGIIYLFKAQVLSNNLFINFLKKSLGRFLQKKQIHTLFIIGLLNGLLPCGLVYIALSGAILTDSPLEGGLYMLGFGLGTLPAMLSISLANKIIPIKSRNFIKRLTPYFIFLFALLLILRGLNLNIPLLSPKMDKQAIHCH